VLDVLLILIGKIEFVFLLIQCVKHLDKISVNLAILAMKLKQGDVFYLNPMILILFVINSIMENVYDAQKEHILVKMEVVLM
jgi:hypothetical protein